MVTFAENKVRQGTRGYRYDAETQNYYVRNRYYLPTLGRWLTRDPIGYQGGINLYEYVQSSPVGNVDAAGLTFLGQRRIVGDTFALRPAYRHSSPGLIHTEQQAVRDMGEITAIGGLSDSLEELSEGVGDVAAWENALFVGDKAAIGEATSEFDQFIAKYETSQVIDAMQRSVQDMINSELGGGWNLNKNAQNSGWAVWVRVKYQEYQEVTTRLDFIFACPAPEWVTHHQWVKVTPAGLGYGSPFGFGDSTSIAVLLPYAFGYANWQVLRGGFQPPRGGAR